MAELNDAEWNKITQLYDKLQARIFYHGRDANLSDEERALMLSMDDDRYERALTETSPFPSINKMLTGYEQNPRQKAKASRPRIKHHTCQPYVRESKSHPYAYCKLCGRVTSNIPVKKLEALAELAKIELTLDEQKVVGLKV